MELWVQVVDCRGVLHQTSSAAGPLFQSNPQVVASCAWKLLWMPRSLVDHLPDQTKRPTETPSVDAFGTR